MSDIWPFSGDQEKVGVEKGSNAGRPLMFDKVGFNISTKNTI